MVATAIGLLLIVPDLLIFSKLILFIYCQREGKGGRKRERNIDWLPPAHSQLGTWPATQACALTGNRTSDPSVCRPVLSPLSHTNQDRQIFSVLKRFDTHIYCELSTIISLVNINHSNKNFFVMRTFKIYFLGNFQIRSTVISTIVATLYITSL